jgi:ferredoxin
LIEKIFYKRNVDKFFNSVKEKYNFYAPVKENQNILFKKISDPEEIELDYFNSKIPPKSIIFPKIETLFKFKKNENGIEIKKPEKPEKKNLIFGIRSCDVASFGVLKEFFGSGKFKDDIVLNKIEDTLLIGLGCNFPKSTCFCTSVNGNPFGTENMDIFLTDLTNKYLIQSITNDGKKLLESLDFLDEPRKEDFEQASDLKNQAELQISSKLELNDTPQILYNNFEHKIWTELSQNCIGCGTCSYLCPTCHCFDVIDENDHYNNKGRRIRIWDTCQYTLFTRETSGHNPRPSRKQRLRQRVLHKFSYYPMNYDVIGCTGCGRCLKYCPVNNDVRKILGKFKELENKKEEEIIVA